jgi:hypothetical protein
VRVWWACEIEASFCFACLLDALRMGAVLTLPRRENWLSGLRIAPEHSSRSTTWSLNPLCYSCMLTSIRFHKATAHDATLIRDLASARQLTPRNLQRRVAVSTAARTVCAFKVLTSGSARLISVRDTFGLSRLHR